MPRRGPVERRQLLPDPVHGRVLVTQLVNKVMIDGKKALAQKIVYAALDDVALSSGLEPLVALKKAVESAKPLLEVRSRRVGGATYPVPNQVSDRRGTSLSIRWIVDAARRRTGAPMSHKLAAELLDALQGTDTAVKRREDLHRMAEANRAFGHFRW